MDKALKGVEELKKGCDSVITILNQRLIEIYGDLSQSMAFEKADDIIATSAKCIAEIVTIPGQINVDFEDVNTVMRNAGTSVLGSAEASGDNRAQDAVENAINSPLLNDRDINGAKKILLNIVSGGGDNEKEYVTVMHRSEKKTDHVLDKVKQIGRASCRERV